jgi:fermentation-respiration switch protein FrsA (DUF1100 family)
LRIVFHVDSTENDGFIATLDSPDQGAYGISCGEVSFDGQQVSILVPQVGGKYEGTFSSQITIDGTWTQGMSSLELDLNYTEEIVELVRPQEPVPPFPYEVKEVSFKNDKAGITLAGTLTLPKGDGAFPATILVSGSGPQDRDEQVFGHKPFLVIADYLTRNGIAVLRYDDRGVGGSTGDFGLATSEDFATDAIAALDFLRTQDGIDSEMVGITGHSEGGLIAPMVAADYSNIGFIVLLAGPGITGKEILLLQTMLISEASGSSKNEINQNLKLLTKVYSLIESENDPEKLDVEIEKLVDDLISSLSEEEKKDPANYKETIMQGLEPIKSPWFKFFMSYDPVSSLVNVKSPVLALNGEKDLQVPPKENLEAIENALKKGGNENFKIQELEGLNHLFQHSETGVPTEYGQLEETFSEEALELIASWINGLKM